MTRTITISDNLYARLESLAKPFTDKEPADVIKRLLDKEANETQQVSNLASVKAPTTPLEIKGRAPRERGAIVSLNEFMISADSVPDLYMKVMEFLFSKGYWERVLEFLPYKTSSKRYLFSKNPRHPNGKDFFVPIKCHDVYVETHKNYKTALGQLEKFLLKCDITLTYKGT